MISRSQSVLNAYNVSGQFSGGCRCFISTAGPLQLSGYVTKHSWLIFCQHFGQRTTQMWVMPGGDRHYQGFEGYVRRCSFLYMSGGLRGRAFTVGICFLWSCLFLRSEKKQQQSNLFFFCGVQILKGLNWPNNPLGTCDGCRCWCRYLGISPWHGLHLLGSWPYSAPSFSGCLARLWSHTTRTWIFQFVSGLASMLLGQHITSI